LSRRSATCGLSSGSRGFVVLSSGRICRVRKSGAFSPSAPLAVPAVPYRATSWGVFEQWPARSSPAPGCVLTCAYLSALLSAGAAALPLTGSRCWRRTAPRFPLSASARRGCWGCFLEGRPAAASSRSLRRPFGSSPSQPDEFGRVFRCWRRSAPSNYGSLYAQYRTGPGWARVRPCWPWLPRPRRCVPGLIGG